MFAYDLKLAWVSIRGNPVLSALMVFAIGLGIAVFLSLYAGYHLLLRDPLPEKSERVYRVLLDCWQADSTAPFTQLDEPSFLMTWIDATNVRRSDIPTYHSPMYRSRVYVHPERSPDTDRQGQEQRPYRASVRLTYNDFFPMFDVPFLYGQPWPETADRGPEPVVVVNRAMNDKLFGGEDSVGRRVFLDNGIYTVVGVLDEWRPSTLFYNLLSSGFGTGDPEDFFAPFMLGDVNQWRLSGGINAGWKTYEGTGWDAHIASEQTWIQYWAQLDTAEQKARFEDFIDAYTQEQKRFERFPRDPLNNQLYDVRRWMQAATHQIDGVAQAFLAIGGMFLLICVVNLVSMLLGKFLEGGRETALRRALGASRGAIFSQRLIEVGLLGLAGGVLGMVLTQGVLAGIRMSFEIPDAYTRLDLHLFAVALSLALIAGLAAGLFPAWRACRVPPASHLNV